MHNLVDQPIRAINERNPVITYRKLEQRLSDLMKQKEK